MTRAAWAMSRAMRPMLPRTVLRAASLISEAVRPLSCASFAVSPPSVRPSLSRMAAANGAILVPAWRYLGRPLMTLSYLMAALTTLAAPPAMAGTLAAPASAPLARPPGSAACKANRAVGPASWIMPRAVLDAAAAKPSPRSCQIPLEKSISGSL